MNTDSSFQNLLEHYVFTVADNFIEQASPDEQQRLLNLFRDIGKHTDPQKSNKVPYWEGQKQSQGW
ncbi:hypothetical protein BH09BAC4_BH09BAC4_14180 [soil metagenome]